MNFCCHVREDAYSVDGNNCAGMRVTPLKLSEPQTTPRKMAKIKGLIVALRTKVEMSRRLPAQVLTQSMQTPHCFYNVPKIHSIALQVLDKGVMILNLTQS